MTIPRLKPSLFICCPSSSWGSRFLRTRPGRIQPRQAAFGIPIPSIKEVSKNWRKKLRGDEDIPKIPVVPRFDEDGNPLKAPKSAAPKLGGKDVMEEDIEMEKSLEEQEERLREFERERRLGKASGGSGVVRRTEEGGRVEEEVPDNVVYPRDVVGGKFRKEKVKYKIDVYPTKNYMGFLRVEGNKKRLAQAAVEIIQEYQQRMNADKLAEVATSTAETALPGGIVLEGVDTKCLALPFPVEAILPTTRLIFAELKDQVRFALSDKQINSISTGLDFVRHLLNPPRPPTLTAPNQTFLYNQLTHISFPANVRILPDVQLKRKQLEAENAKKSRQAKIEQLRKQAELLESVKRKKLEEMIMRREKPLRQKRALKREEEEKLKKEENYSQFYGRPM